MHRRIVLITTSWFPTGGCFIAKAAYVWMEPKERCGELGGDFLRSQSSELLAFVAAADQEKNAFGMENLGQTESQSVGRLTFCGSEHAVAQCRLSELGYMGKGLKHFGGLIHGEVAVCSKPENTDIDRTMFSHPLSDASGFLIRVFRLGLEACVAI